MKRSSRGVVGAIVEPETLTGRDVRAVLEERAFPLSSLHLFGGAPETEGRILADAGDAAWVAPLAPDSLATCDVAFLCGSAAASARFLAACAASRCVVIDLSGLRSGGQLAYPGRPLPDGNLWLLPDPTAVLVAEAVRRFPAGTRLSRLSVTVDRPVSELGKPALDELFEQALSIVSFRPVPKEVLGGQLAFNVTCPSDSAAYEERIAEDFARLVGSDVPIEVFSARSGVFHGHFVRVTASLDGDGPTLATLRESLLGDGSAFEEVDPEEPAGPVQAAGRDEALLLRVAAEGSSIRLAFASDHLRLAGAVAAVRLAEEAVEARGLLADA
jgi:aspartate-semialdehyde dehydrogenase